MKIKRLLAGLLSVVLLITAVSGCGSNSKSSTSTTSASSSAAGSTASASSSDGSTIKIGCVFPITGANADQGVFNVDGCQFAIDQINEAGGIKSLGGAKLELVTYDNQSDADQCKGVAERMLQENSDLTAVTGAGSSSYVLPMLPVFEKAKIPFLTGQVSDSITNQGYQYVFRIGSNSSSFAETQVKFLEWLNSTYNLNIKKIGIVYEDTEWGISNTKGAVTAIQNSTDGFEIAYNESFQANSSDLTNIVVGLKNAGCDVVFPTCYTQDAKLLFNTMQSMDYDPLIIGGGGGFLYPAFAQELGDLVNGVVSVTSHNNDIKTITGNSSIADIGKKFEAKYGYFMPEQAVIGYSAIYLISQALETCASKDPTVVAQTIRSLTCSSATPGGAVSFDGTGANTNAEAIIVQWQKDGDGSYRPHCVFPSQEGSTDFQLTDALKALTKG